MLSRRSDELNRNFPNFLKKSILQYAVQGKLVSQDPTDEPASVLLEHIRAEKEKLIKSGKINSIIVKDLSRLGRNYIEMGKYLEQIFPMMGIRFIAINDNYDNANTESSDSDSIVVPFKNLLNDSFSVSCCSDDRSKSVVLDRSGKNLGSTCTVAVNNNRHRLRKLVFIIR